eukprot:749235-Hanusia_phi.AAC.3
MPSSYRLTEEQVRGARVRWTLSQETPRARIPSSSRSSWRRAGDVRKSPRMSSKEQRGSEGALPWNKRKNLTNLSHGRQRVFELHVSCTIVTTTRSRLEQLTAEDLFQAVLLLWAHQASVLRHSVSSPPRCQIFALLPMHVLISILIPPLLLPAPHSTSSASKASLAFLIIITGDTDHSHTSISNSIANCFCCSGCGTPIKTEDDERNRSHRHPPQVEGLHMSKGSVHILELAQAAEHSDGKWSQNVISQRFAIGHTGRKTMQEHCDSPALRFALWVINAQVTHAAVGAETSRKYLTNPGSTRRMNDAFRYIVGMCIDICDIVSVVVVGGGGDGEGGRGEEIEIEIRTRMRMRMRMRMWMRMMMMMRMMKGQE